MYMTLGQSESH